MEMSVEINELAAALSKAQGTMKAASKDAVNPHFKSSYSTLASVWDAARGPLSMNGLSIVQGAHAEAERVAVTTVLMHTSGQWMRDTLTMAARDSSPQSIGSAVSYGRRYGLSAMVGVAPDDDDDGEANRPSNGQSRWTRRDERPKPQTTTPDRPITPAEKAELVEAARVAGWTGEAVQTFITDNYGAWSKIQLSQFAQVMSALRDGVDSARDADEAPAGDINDSDIPF
jgi:hypothetical protein